LSIRLFVENGLLKSVTRHYYLLLCFEKQIEHRFCILSFGPPGLSAIAHWATAEAFGVGGAAPSAACPEYFEGFSPESDDERVVKEDVG